MKIVVQRKEAETSKTTVEQGRSRRKGSVVVFVAATLFMMLGFCALAVDYGTSVAIKNHLQRTCDAAALAGAAELLATKVPATDKANAIQEAKNAASNNRVTIEDSDITFPDALTRIRVSKVQPRKFLFGWFAGMTQGKVPATALAGRTYVTGLKGLDPLGVTMQTYRYFTPTERNPSPAPASLVLTRNTQEEFGPKNFLADGTTANTVNNGSTFNVAALDLRHDNSGNSGALFQSDVATANNDYQANIGDIVDPLGSSVVSQGNKLARGIQDRIDRATGAPWFDTGQHQYDYTANGVNNKKAIPDYLEGNPRIIYILVSRDGYSANNSNPKLNLQYFAPVYIEGPVDFTKGNAPQAVLKVRFMPGDLSNAASGIVLSTTGVDTGLSVVRLMG